MSKFQFDLESVSSWLAILRGLQVYHGLELTNFTSLNNAFGLVLGLALIYLVNACESGEKCNIRKEGN